MARIDQQVARQVAEGAVIAVLVNAGLSATDAQVGADMLVDRAEEVSLTTAGVLVLRYDITQPKPDSPPQQDDEV